MIFAAWSCASQYLFLILHKPSSNTVIVIYLKRFFVLVWKSQQFVAPREIGVCTFLLAVVISYDVCVIGQHNVE